ncbi:MAG: DUF1080 domain-containing protein [Planctomycetaceae bacterium]|nr:DUF1080 domain-containing protein [Planctomycetaceae bacterium]
MIVVSNITRHAATLVVLWGLAMSGELGAEEAQRKSLFNGKNLDGWVVTGCQAEVRSGVLFAKGGNGLIRTEKQYQDFTFELEWRALKKEKWDAGIYFRFNKLPKAGPWPARYQANLLQGHEGNVNGLPTAKSSGLVKDGQWNTLRLTVVGGNAKLEMNGKQAWKSGGVKEPKGFIGIQVEVPGGGQFEYKNIYVTDLSK